MWRAADVAKNPQLLMMAVGLQPDMDQRMARILVVSQDSAECSTLVEWLSAAGHTASAVSDFPHAKRQLDAFPPDVLIANVKLGQYNGLHLAIRAKFAPSPTPVLVVGPADAVLQAEAERQHAGYLTVPVGHVEVLDGVDALLARHRAARRTIRKRISNVGAYVDGNEAMLIEVSYDGLRFEVPGANADAVPSIFTLRVPTFNLACRMQRVWVQPPPETCEAWSCGAALATDDASVAVAWRAFVDAVPGWTITAAAN